MKYKVNIYRPAKSTTSVEQSISQYNLIFSNVPIYIQPASSEIQEFYYQRGLVNVSTIISNQTSIIVDEEDVIELGTDQYHVVGKTKMLNVYVEWNVQQYPEGSKKRLNMEAYAS